MCFALEAVAAATQLLLWISVASSVLPAPVLLLKASAVSSRVIVRVALELCTD